MQVKKLTKKLEGIILKKRSNNLEFFTLEYSSYTKLFFKKVKNYKFVSNNTKLKHPLGLRRFEDFVSLKLFLKKTKNNVIYVRIGKLFLKTININSIYLDNVKQLQNFLIILKKHYQFWYFI